MVAVGAGLLDDHPVQGQCFFIHDQVKEAVADGAQGLFQIKAGRGLEAAGRKLLFAAVNHRLRVQVFLVDEMTVQGQFRDVRFFGDFHHADAGKAFGRKQFGRRLQDGLAFFRIFRPAEFLWISQIHHISVPISTI